MQRYDGKRVLITGGTSGIGLATARMLLDQGARVLVTGRTKQSLESARAELGMNATVMASDATSLADIEALAGEVKAEFGILDLLFVNAGLPRYVPFISMTEALFDESLAINAKGPYFTVQKMAPLMPEGSAVVLTTSIANSKGAPSLSAYSAGKAALRSMARSLASELLSRGIRVNAVSPGPIDTMAFEKSFGTDVVNEARQRTSEIVPMKRLGLPQEVAKAVIFLGFEATFTTGAEFVVDGGLSQL